MTGVQSRVPRRRRETGGVPESPGAHVVSTHRLWFPEEIRAGPFGEHFHDGILPALSG